jgi:DNA-directed RNA polymerase specialized sigma24 family protein
MHEVHGVALEEVALALGIAPIDAQNLLARARRRIRAADKPASGAATKVGDKPG